MDSYFFILTTIDLFVLGFMSLLTKLSESLNKKQKRGFLLAFALIACISVLEVITIVVDGAPTGCRWLNILSNYLGFGLTPAVALCLVYVLDKKSIIRRGFKAAVCCEGAYLLFLAATLPYGLVFSVGRENLYARGEYFYIYVAMYYAAMLYLMVATVRTATAFQNRSRTLICPLTVSGGGDRDPDRAAIAARHMAVRHPAVGVVLYLLQRDVEPVGRPDRTFEPEQLPEPHRRDAPQRRGAGGVRCG